MRYGNYMVWYTAHRYKDNTFCITHAVYPLLCRWDRQEMRAYSFDAGTRTQKAPCPYLRKNRRYRNFRWTWQHACTSCMRQCNEAARQTYDGYCSGDNAVLRHNKTHKIKRCEDMRGNRRHTAWDWHNRQRKAAFSGHRARYKRSIGSIWKRSGKRTHKGAYEHRQSDRRTCNRHGRSVRACSRLGDLQRRSYVYVRCELLDT